MNGLSIFKRNEILVEKSEVIQISHLTTTGAIFCFSVFFLCFAFGLEHILILQICGSLLVINVFHYISLMPNERVFICMALMKALNQNVYQFLMR